MNMVMRGKGVVENGASFGRQFLHAHHVGLVALEEEPEGGLTLGPVLGAPQVVGDKGQAHWKHG